MDSLTAAHLADLTGARLIGDPDALVGPKVVIDSRQATPGALFVALPGERVDGHDFAAAAVERGAVAVLVARELDLPIPQLIVPDTLSGLGRLARGLVALARGRGLQVVGITGSSGKTSTKDLLAAVLRAAGPTVAPVGSLNNEIGVPLTATQADATTRYLVSEMGARALGDITKLCAITPPAIGVVLNVGHAHLGEFGSVATIAQAKGELVEAVGPGGWAVLNADDPNVLAMAERTHAQLATFSVSGRPGTGGLRVWAEGVQADPLQRHSFLLCTDSGRAPVTLKVAGAHQVANALAAAAAGLALGQCAAETGSVPDRLSGSSQDAGTPSSAGLGSTGLDVASIAEALSAAEPASRWRMELTERPDGLLVVNDAYNANPDSTSAALRALAGLRRPNGRLVAVLGDMLELGPQSAQAHRQVGELAGDLGIEQVVALGEFAHEIAGGASARGSEATVVPDREAAARAVASLVSPSDVVLVKASRGLALETVAEQVLAEERSGWGR